MVWNGLGPITEPLGSGIEHLSEPITEQPDFEIPWIPCVARDNGMCELATVTVVCFSVN
jgi:hypothetical protein